MHLSFWKHSLLVTREWQPEYRTKEGTQATATWGKNPSQVHELAGDQSLTQTWDLTKGSEESAWKALGTSAGISNCPHFPSEQVLWGREIEERLTRTCAYLGTILVLPQLNCKLE